MIRRSKRHNALFGTHARRPRHVRGFLAQVVGILERWLHFARGFGRGRRAEAFNDNRVR
jgi:hypothetical protein